MHIKLPRGQKCLSKTLSKQQEIFGKKKKNHPFPHIAPPHSTSPNIPLSPFINQSARKFIIYLCHFKATHLNNVGCASDEGGAARKTTKWQPHQNHPGARASASHQCHPSLRLSPWAGCSAGSPVHVHMQVHTHTDTPSTLMLPLNKLSFRKKRNKQAHQPPLWFLSLLQREH